MLFELERRHATRAAASRCCDELSARLPAGATLPRRARRAPASRPCCGCSTGSPTPTPGAVPTAARDVRERDPLALRREVGLVPQLPALLDGHRRRQHRASRPSSPAASPTSRGCSSSPASTPASPTATRRSSRSASSSGRCWPGRWRSSRACCCSTSRPRRSTRRRRGAVEATLTELRERLEISLVLVTHDLDQAGGCRTGWCGSTPGARSSRGRPPSCSAARSAMIARGRDRRHPRRGRGEPRPRRDRDRRLALAADRARGRHRASRSCARSSS